MEGEMRTLCAGLKEKVDRFLRAESSDELVKNVQSQVRVAKGIIDDALKRYKYGLSRPVATILHAPQMLTYRDFAAGRTSWRSPITAARTASSS